MASMVSWAWASLPPSFFTCGQIGFFIHTSSHWIHYNQGNYEHTNQSTPTQQQSKLSVWIPTSTITSKSVPNKGCACLIDSWSFPGSVISLDGSVTRRPAFLYTSLSFWEPVEKVWFHDNSQMAVSRYYTTVWFLVNSSFYSSSLPSGYL